MTREHTANGRAGPVFCWSAARLSAALCADANASARRSAPGFPGRWLCSQPDGASSSAAAQATAQATRVQAAWGWLSLAHPGGSCWTIHRRGADLRYATPDLHVCGWRSGHVLLPGAFDWDACNQARTRSSVGGLCRGLS
jgi:hypothetical protein